ncbi:MAG: hypothetical protein GY927_13945 [bacterium]|nr:hypothetical protein [bacterium]
MRTYDGSLTTITLNSGANVSATADTFIDVLTFAGSSGAVTGANVDNFEEVVIGSGSTISFSDDILAAPTTTVTNGGVLDATGGGLALTGNLANDGTVTMQDGIAGDEVGVSGDYAGTGELRVDVNLATYTSDVLAVDGDVTGGTTTISPLARLLTQRPERN